MFNRTYVSIFARSFASTLALAFASTLALAFASILALALTLVAVPAGATLAQTPETAPPPENMTMLESTIPGKGELGPATLGTEMMKRPFGSGGELTGRDATEAMSAGTYGSWTVETRQVRHNPSTTTYPNYAAGLEFQELYYDDGTADYSGLWHGYWKETGAWIVSSFASWDDNPDIFATDLSMYYALTSNWPSAELFDEQLLEFSDTDSSKTTQVARSFYYHHAGSDGFEIDSITQTISVAFGNWIYDIWATYPAGDFDVFEDAIGSFMGSVDFPFDQIG